jgi:hypothetical protein
MSSSSSSGSWSQASSSTSISHTGSSSPSSPGDSYPAFDSAVAFSRSEDSSDPAPSRRDRIANSLHHRLRSLNIPPNLHSMTAGAGAGLVASIITCPLDVIKTRLQAQAVSRVDKGYEGAGRTVGRIWAQSGVRGFYRGLGPTLGGYLPTWGIYFTVYDDVKDRLGNWGNVTGGESRERGKSASSSSSSSPSWLR